MPEKPDWHTSCYSESTGTAMRRRRVKQVVAWAAQAGYERLWASVRAWNTASRRVLQKLAFVETRQVERDSVHGDSLLTVKELGPTVR